MQPQIFRQSGKWMIFILMIASLFCLNAIINTLADNGVGLTILIGVLIVLQVCMALFYQLTITVTEETVSFRMGIGLIRKSYRICDIQSCNAVQNNLLLGLGIHYFMGGVLYNVSGRKAIELHFKNRNKVVRIGTDRPEEIAKLINLLINR
jgi:hypothetical protein